MQFVVDFGDFAVIFEVFGDVVLVEGALWEEGAGCCAQGEQEHEGQGGAHAGEPVPCFFDCCEKDFHAAPLWF